MQREEKYVAPQISTLERAEIIEALGPVSAGSGGQEPCEPAFPMGPCE